MRERIDATGPWRLELDVNDDGEALGYPDPDCDIGGWCEVTVPCVFEDCGPALERHEGIGWFRRTVQVPAAWEGKRVVVRFEGVNNSARVWVNGTAVGDHPDAYLGFELCVHDVVRYGDANVVVVRVDNTRRTDTIPGGGLGWHPSGGIPREVELVATDRLHIASVRVVAEPDASGGRLALQPRLVNARATAAGGRLAAEVLDHEGELCAALPASSIHLAAGEEAEVAFVGALPGARPWSPEEPVIYTARIGLESGGEMLDRCDVRFGFRRIEVKDGGLCLNGQPVFLTGFNRHEDSPERAMCVDLKTARADVLAMKRMGANFVRLAHYPHHPGTLDLCDELGLLAMCEIPLYWWAGLADGEAACRQILEAARRQLTKLILRDLNHPSVIWWSVSNECHTQRPEVLEGHEELLRLAKELDPTRLAVHVSDHWAPSSGSRDRFDSDDVICVNGYPDPATGAEWWAEELAALHEAYPQKPIVVTEFGGMGNDEDEQVRCIEAGFAGITAPYVGGTVVWCWADHPWPRELGPFSPYGVLTRDRRERKAARIVEQGFRDSQRRFAQDLGQDGAP